MRIERFFVETEFQGSSDCTVGGQRVKVRLCTEGASASDLIFENEPTFRH